MTTLSPHSSSPASMQNDIPTDGAPAPSQVQTASAKPAGKGKPRKRVNTAEKRHQHNAIERQRRETLNGKFISLARLLPSLAASRRPSKSAIVNGSIAHLTYQRDQRLLAARLLRRLAAEHDALLNEVNEWRKAGGFAMKDSAPAWTDEMEEVCLVEKEVFGNFASFDENDNENDNDDNEDEIPTDPMLERANMTAANFSGIITPRSSTELDVLAHTQAMFGTAPLRSQVDQRNPSARGMSWSHDFAFGANSMSASVSSSASLPFGAFMSDSLDVSSSASPTNSIHGPVLTPPNTGDAMLLNHTPSPRSSHSIPDDRLMTAPLITPTVPSQSSGWTEQQLHFLRHQVQQQQMQRKHQHAAAGLAHATAATSFPPAVSTGMFSGMFPQQQPQMQPAAQAPALLATQSATDAFTQSLLASVFPSSGVPAEQVEQWRKLALAGVPQQTMQLNSQTLRNIGRTPSGHAMNMASMWENRAVEGF